MEAQASIFIQYTRVNLWNPIATGYSALSVKITLRRPRVSSDNLFCKLFQIVTLYGTESADEEIAFALKVVRTGV